MALYAIGDLHLSSNSYKPMDVFGSHWLHHNEKIRESWTKNVEEEDLVLIAGDISWAMRLNEAREDLDWISVLPGKKVLVRGNHDYWWTSISKLNSLYDNMNFIQNNCYCHDNLAICGTRGWISPNSSKFSDEDYRIYLREVRRLELSLQSAEKQGYNKIIVMLHYPPTNDQLEPSHFTELVERYRVEEVVYGHLHGEESFAAGLQGLHRGVKYRLVSCDYLNFNLLRIT